MNIDDNLEIKSVSDDDNGWDAFSKAKAPKHGSSLGTMGAKFSPFARQNTKSLKKASNITKEIGDFEES